MSRRITSRATLAKAETMQSRIDELSSKADPELAEALNGVSASLELVIELLNGRIHANDRFRQLFTN
jgi:hypothetical protein